MDSHPSPPSSHRSTSVTRFEYVPPVVLAGQGAATELGAELTEQGIDSALVVCNRSVGSTPAVIDSIIESLGDRSKGVFSEVQSHKRLRTAWEAAQQVREHDASGIVGVGSGSAIDVATVASSLVDTDRSFDEIRAYFREHHRLPLEHLPRPVLTVPTTLAGAEFSQGAGITATTPDAEGMIAGGVSDPKLQPLAVVYDPELVVHTPTEVLTGSAMNGFNKGIEMLYSPAATPVTDATASRGLEVLVTWLPELAASEPSVETLDAILEGSMLVQFGVSRPDTTGLSIIHAFGHGVTSVTSVQQGIAHAIVTPHVLRALFDRGDCRQDLLAETFGVDSAQGVIKTIEDLRDDLGLPDRFSALDAFDRSMLQDIAEATAEDRLMENLPHGVTISLDDIHDILEAAW